MKQTTLCLLLKEDQILLAMKKRGFGMGKWNGTGGKVEIGETIEQAAVRETEEEISVKIDPRDLDHKADWDFYFPHKPEWDLTVRLFLCYKWQGEPIETEEMRPQWFKFSEIPYDQMWDDDKHWLPKVLTGKKFKGQFYFGPDNATVEKFEIIEI
ncbi:MAG TPA: 8-oxo-dGTP diphosphatase [Methylomirabilota bacterium]|jgi:mutator protein MutT|nr:8-oxo-dGTP diphosphatase [Methylomirabilota bacterium]